MKRAMLMIMACLIYDTLGTETNIVNETLNTTMNEVVNSKKVMATTDGLLRIWTVLSTAASLSIYFFIYLFGFLFRMIMYFISPFLWIIQFCWQQFVTKPFDLLLYVLHTLYPVLMFCLAAIGCGIFIGGCAGFAAEAFSSILITATWGPQPRIKEIEQEEEEETLQLSGNIKELMETEDEDEIEEPFHQKPKLKSRSSSISSFYKKPFMNSWRDSFSSSASLSQAPTSASNVNSVLIRRMKLSSPDEDTRPKLKSRKNSWEWDEDDD